MPVSDFMIESSTHIDKLAEKRGNSSAWFTPGMLCEWDLVWFEWQKLANYQQTGLIPGSELRAEKELKFS